MRDDKIKYFEIGDDKDNPLFSIEYLEESRAIKKENKTLSIGWQYQVGTVTKSANKQTAKSPLL